MGQTVEDFSPFYERLAARVRGYLIGKLLVSGLLGAAFFAAHVGAVGRDALHDWSWLLAALITTAMLCLYYATHTLRGMLPLMSLRMRQAGESDDAFMKPIRKHLADRRFIVAGLLFGVLNCAVGYRFGLPKGTTVAHETLLIGFFLAGFVCGMAACGVLGVTIAVSAFGRKVCRGLRYDAPDHCGGVRFIGEGLSVFSSVTLIVGVLISLYILLAPWSGGRTNSLLVVALKWCWIVLPFLLSLTILVGPAVPINEAAIQGRKGSRVTRTSAGPR